MKIVTYTPELFESLKRTVKEKNSKLSLTHRSFVNYYYATSAWSRLYLMMEGQKVLGTIGVETMRFEWQSKEMIIGLANNFHSFNPGIGGLLFLHWIKTAPFCLNFGGTKEAHRIIQKQRWTYFNGVKIYLLNKSYLPYPGEAIWRVIAKKVLRRVRRKKLSRYSTRIRKSNVDKLSVREEEVFSKGLVPKTSPFAFRLAPTVDYLNWRYNTKLPFVRYRVFRILIGDSTSGYVVLNESPERILLAQCDGEDPEILAYGILLSLAQVSYRDKKSREIFMTSSHRRMQEIFESFGFRAESSERLFAMGSLKKIIEIAPDTSNWLINFDWTDNGLRRPFLDQDEDTLPFQCTVHHP